MLNNMGGYHALQEEEHSEIFNNKTAKLFHLSPRTLTKLNAKILEILPSHIILNILLKVMPILVLVRQLRPNEMHSIPMQTHKSRYQKLISVLLVALLLIRGLEVGLRAAGIDIVFRIARRVRLLRREVLERVVEEHGITGRAVNNTVEDVCYDFALYIC
jgi:hypothetical protein